MDGLERKEKDVLDAIETLTAERGRSLKSIEIANFLGRKQSNKIWRQLSALESYGFIVRTGYGRSRRIVLTGGGKVERTQPVPIHIREAQERIRLAVGYYEY